MNDEAFDALKGRAGQSPTSRGYYRTSVISKIAWARWEVLSSLKSGVAYSSESLPTIAEARNYHIHFPCVGHASDYCEMLLECELLERDKI